MTCQVSRKPIADTSVQRLWFVCFFLATARRKGTRNKLPSRWSSWKPAWNSGMWMWKETHRPDRAEQFPGADLWHTYLIRTQISVRLLIKCQPGAIAWSAQERPNHPPFSHWIAYCFYDIGCFIFLPRTSQWQCKCTVFSGRVHYVCTLLLCGKRG